MIRTATISTCDRYRYRLERIWDADRFSALWIMLNPSTADGTRDDATIRRCVSFSKGWLCGGIVVVNLFGLRATHPRDLRASEAPNGPDNDQHLRIVAARSWGRVVAAWGCSGGRLASNRAIELMTGSGALAGIGMKCLGMTKDGSPRHPVRLAAASRLEPFLAPESAP